MSYDPMEEIRYLERMSARPRWSTVLLTGALLGLLLVGLGLWVVEAEGQTKQNGVGYPDPSHARFESAGTFPLNPDAHPWGQDGGVYEASAGAPRAALDVGLYRARYGAGTNIVGQRPIGMWDESEGLNAVWLKLWYERQPEAHQRLWSGIASYEEVVDAAMSLPRLSAYGPVFEVQEGGLPKTAIVIDAANYARNSWHFRFDNPRRLGADELRPVLGVQQTTNLYGYPRYYDVRWLPGTTPPPPAPSPVPPPPAPPPPATTPCPPSRLTACEGLKNPFGQSVCSGCPCPEEMPEREKAWNCTPGTAPPPAPLNCEQCKSIGYVDVDCSVCPCPSELFDSVGHRHVIPGRFCNPINTEPPPVRTCIVWEVVAGQKIALPKFIPGIPSTARLELVLVPMGEAPCP